MVKTYFRTLTIAGSDSGGGAGIQADIKTFSALGCYGMSVITALTAQNTKVVKSVYDVAPKFVADQLDAVFEDIGVDAVKIGMLHKKQIIKVVTEKLNFYKPAHIVLDPVMISKSGDRLLQDTAIKTLRSELIPLATVITPNLPEASVLLNRSILTEHDIERAAQDLLSLGAQAVLIKGGHRKNNDNSSDYFIGGRSCKETWLIDNRINTINTHGTGCTLSAAICAFLAQKHELCVAVKKAKSYITQAIQKGSEYSLGRGNGPVHH